MNEEIEIEGLRETKREEERGKKANARRETQSKRYATRSKLNREKSKVGEQNMDKKRMSQPK